MATRKGGGAPLGNKNASKNPGTGRTGPDLNILGIKFYKAGNPSMPAHMQQLMALQASGTMKPFKRYNLDGAHTGASFSKKK